MGSIVPPHVGRVAHAVGHLPPYRLTDVSSTLERPANLWLRAMFASDKSPLTIRSYAHDLLRFSRFLSAIDVDWARVTPDDYVDFVLWARVTRKARTATGGKRTAKPSVNMLTGKPNPGETLAPTTINHSDTVLRAFYEYWGARGEGPVLNPVPSRDGITGRAHSHHNPLEPFTRSSRRSTRQKETKRLPRSMPDGAYEQVFGSLTSDRDRALLESYLSTGARATELLTIEGKHVDYGEQQYLVVRKGTRQLQLLQASPDAFAWLVKYQAEHGPAGPDERVWRALRGPSRPLTYDAMKRVFDRVNSRLGTNWTPHDLRHTCAIRMIESDALSIRDVQQILGHAHVTTTEKYLRARPDEVIRRVREHHRRLKDAPPPPGASALAYGADDLLAVFGGRA